jgi:hypothetical protein
MDGKETKLSCKLIAAELGQRNIPVFAGVWNLVMDKLETAKGSRASFPFFTLTWHDYG